MSGEAWWRLYDEAGSPDLDARSVPCPTCGAAAGTYCKRPSGHKAWDAHAERWDDAVRALATTDEEATVDDDLDLDDLDADDDDEWTPGTPGDQAPDPGPREPPKDGQLYQYHAYARCDGCRTWWRRLVECRYRVDHTRRDFLGGPVIHGERVRDIDQEWQRAPGAGSSFALWLNVEDGARGGCPTCTQTAAQTTLDLDAPAPGHGTTAADYSPDQAGHYDNPPAPYSGPATEEEALAALVPAGFVEQLDTRAGTAQVVDQLKAAGVTRPTGAPWNFNRLANLCTFAALDLRRAERDTEPKPGEQLALI